MVSNNGKWEAGGSRRLTWTCHAQALFLFVGRKGIAHDYLDFIIDGVSKLQDVGRAGKCHQVPRSNHNANIMHDSFVLNSINPINIAFTQGLRSS